MYSPSLRFFLHDGKLGLGHPGEVGVDDPPLEPRIARAVEPLPQRPQRLQPGPQVGIAGQLDQPVRQVRSRVHAVELVGEDPGRAPPHARIGIVAGPGEIASDADSLVAQPPEGPGRGPPDDLGGIAQPLHQGLGRLRPAQPSQAGRGRRPHQGLGIVEPAE